jgi:hypothetical protein
MKQEAVDRQRAARSTGIRMSSRTVKSPSVTSVSEPIIATCKVELACINLNDAIDLEMNHVRMLVSLMVVEDGHDI